MQGSDHSTHKSCLTCGKYVEAEMVVDHFYCSRECAQKYSRCPSCGKFFPIEDEYQGYCSPDCNSRLKDPSSFLQLMTEPFEQESHDPFDLEESAKIENSRWKYFNENEELV